MAGEIRNKINNLHRVATRGSPLTSAWLRQQGVSYKLAWWYVKSGWLDRIADGVYCFSEEQITWAGALAAIQQQVKLPIYVGGKTALQLLGRVHYINKEVQFIQLFGSHKTKLPKWVRSPYWNVSWLFYSPALFSRDDAAWRTTVEVNGIPLDISSPEKASLELCFLVPKVVSFAEAALILEGLPRMRPKVLQGLLESCRSYKAKRLLLYWGDYFSHAWMQDIHLHRIDLGKGKRVVSGGGQYNAKYQLSVPILDDMK